MTVLPTQQNLIGMIHAVHGPVVDITCTQLPSLHRALWAALDGERYTFEVYQHLDEQHVRAITLHDTAGLQRGMPVFDSGGPLRAPVSPDCLGRLIDVFGDPLDGGLALKAEQLRNIVETPTPLHETVGASGILETGIKVIDLLCPFVRGGKTGLFGGGRDRQDRPHHRIHACHCLAASGSVGLCGGGGTDSRRPRALA